MYRTFKFTEILLILGFAALTFLVGSEAGYSHWVAPAPGIACGALMALGQWVAGCYFNLGVRSGRAYETSARSIRVLSQTLFSGIMVTATKTDGRRDYTLIKQLNGILASVDVDVYLSGSSSQCPRLQVRITSIRPKLAGWYDVAFEAEIITQSGTIFVSVCSPALRCKLTTVEVEKSLAFRILRQLDEAVRQRDRNIAAARKAEEANASS